MADEEIELVPLEGIPTADALTGAEWALLVQGGNSRKVDVNTIAAFIEQQGLTEVRLPAGSTATLASTDHPFQIGADAASNMVMSPNRIQARHDGGDSFLYLNPEGGRVQAPQQLYALGNTPILGLQDADATDLDGLHAYMMLQTHAAGGYEIGAQIGCLSPSNKHIHVRNFGTGGGIYLQPESGAVYYAFAQSGADMGANVLHNVADPSAGSHIGDRDYNDGRYAHRFHMSAIIENPIANKHYWISRQLPQNVVIDQVVTYTAAGTCNVAVVLGATSTGALAASTTEAVHAISPGISGSPGQSLRINCTALSSVEDVTVDIIGDYA